MKTANQLQLDLFEPDLKDVAKVLAHPTAEYFQRYAQTYGVETEHSRRPLRVGKFVVAGEIIVVAPFVTHVTILRAALKRCEGWNKQYADALADGYGPADAAKGEWVTDAGGFVIAEDARSVTVGSDSTAYGKGCERTRARTIELFRAGVGLEIAIHDGGYGLVLQ